MIYLYRFVVGPSPLYRLTVGQFDQARSTLGDSMKYHNGQPFSTRDQGNDAAGGHCAVRWKGGWWYKSCHNANLNGLNYGSKKKDQKGIKWYYGGDRGNSSINFKEATMEMFKN